MVSDPASIRYELEKALWYALNGRPGPVWLDVPLNIQGALIDEAGLTGFAEPDCEVPAPGDDKMQELMALLKKAKRPLFIAGHGISISGAAERFRKLIRLTGIPAVTTFCGVGLLDDADPLFAGRIGTVGQRAGNFVLQNSDLVISLGSRNNIRQVSYNWENFASRAVKVSVDIDGEELKKKLFVPDLPILADAGAFIDSLYTFAEKEALPDSSE